MSYKNITFNKLEPLKMNSVEFFKYVLFVSDKKLYLMDKESNNIVEMKGYNDPLIFKLKESDEEAEIYLIKPEEDHITRFSFFFPESGKGGIRLDSYDIKLGFTLSEEIEVDSFLDDLIIVDVKNKKYVMFLSMKKRYGAKIDVLNFAKVKMFDKNSAFILTDLALSVILNGERSVIKKEKLDIDLLSLKEWAVVKEGEKSYLLLSNSEKVVVVSLNEEDKFYFGVFDKDPFEKFKIEFE